MPDPKLAGDICLGKSKKEGACIEEVEALSEDDTYAESCSLSMSCSVTKASFRFGPDFGDGGLS